MSGNPVDEALLRMRRSLEWAGLISRSFAVVWILTSIVVLPIMSVGLALFAAAAEALVNGLAVVALRSVGRPRYLRLSAILVAVDTAAIIAMVGSAAASPDLVLWPLLIIPIIVAAYRHQLAGALIVCAAAIAACVLLYWQAPHLVGHPMPADLVTVAPGLGLVVAVLTGLLSRAHHIHLGQLAQARASLREQALHDPLTGLGNRNRLHEHACDVLRPGDVASVLVLDLDGFKPVNDELGHAAGDELLTIVAQRLRAQVRDGDLPARLGGDEFVVLLPDTDAPAAREVAERVRAALVAPIQLGPHTVGIDASIGAATARDGDLDNLLRTADAEMYRVKSAHHLLRDPARLSPAVPRAAAAKP